MGKILEFILGIVLGSRDGSPQKTKTRRPEKPLLTEREYEVMKAIYELGDKGVKGCLVEDIEKKIGRKLEPDELEHLRGLDYVR